MKKLSIMGLILVMLLTLLTGCQTDSANSTETTTVSEVPVSSENVELTL